MKLTKYGHACFTVEHEGKLLVVDPGGLSPDYIPSEHTVAVIVTHAHGDHFSPDTLAAIYGKSPESLLLSTEEVTSSMSDHKSQTVTPGQAMTVGPFKLEFFGGSHATIHNSVPVIDNIGVMINDTLYYPGDSFVLPNKEVGTLALPLAAPWLKVSEAIDFMVAVAPKTVFSTHDAVLSDSGKMFHDSWIQRFAEPLHTSYRRLESGQELLLK